MFVNFGSKTTILESFVRRTSTFLSVSLGLVHFSQFR